jgi:hypothetical protein
MRKPKAPAPGLLMTVAAWGCQLTASDSRTPVYFVDRHTVERVSSMGGATHVRSAADSGQNSPPTESQEHLRDRSLAMRSSGWVSDR